jgi:8-oxo-dGTP diphosphatase
MVFNYLATSFEGELLKNPLEGDLLCINVNEAMELPMQDWFKRRFPLFFKEGTFELSYIWDRNKDETIKKTIRQYGVGEIKEADSVR